MDYMDGFPKISNVQVALVKTRKNYLRCSRPQERLQTDSF